MRVSRVIIGVRRWRINQFRLLLDIIRGEGGGYRELFFDKSFHRLDGSSSDLVIIQSVQQPSDNIYLSESMNIKKRKNQYTFY